MTPATRLVWTWIQRHRHADLTQAHLGRLLDLSPRTVGAALADLTVRGLITSTPQPLPTGGRKANRIAMKPKVSAPRLFAVTTPRPDTKRQTALDDFRATFGDRWARSHGQPYLITNYHATLGQWTRFCTLVPDADLRAAVIDTYLEDRDPYLRDRGHALSSMLVDWRIQGYLLKARRRLDATRYDAQMVEATEANESRWSLRDLLERCDITRNNWRWFDDVIRIDTTDTGLTLVFRADSDDIVFATKHFATELSRAAGRPVDLRRAS